MNNLRKSLKLNPSSKKGQITVFMIIGIVILFTTMFVFYARTKTVSLEGFKEPVIEELPLQLQPVSAYVDNCMIEAAEKGIKLIGEHGGYLDVNCQDFNCNFLEPTESEVIEFFPGSDNWLIPYWYHMSSKNDCAETGTCAFDQQIPSLIRDGSGNSIEEQLDEYVKYETLACLNNFNVFENQGYTIEINSPLIITTKVLEKEVAFLADYAVSLDRDDLETSSKIEQFYVKIPVELKKVYDQALLLTKLQANFTYLEQDMLYWIRTYSGIDAEIPPPKATGNEPFNFKFWLEHKVSQVLEDILVTNIRNIQVIGTDNYKLIKTGNPSVDYAYELLEIPNEISIGRDLEVYYDYRNWNIYSDLNCKSGLCSPETITAPVIPFIGVQDYNFPYDVSFPIIVEISSPNSFNNGGFNFYIALESNIRSNEPLSSGFMENKVVTEADVSHLCDFDKRTGNITIYVTDSITDKPLEGVNIVFEERSTGETCSLGPQGQTNSSGIAVVGLPSGVLNGAVTLIKKDPEDMYLTKSFYLSTPNNLELAPIKTSMNKIFEKKIDVRQYKVTQQGKGWVPSSNAVEIEQGDEVIIKLERRNELTTEFEEEFQSYAVYKEGDEFVNMQIAAGGIYDIELDLLRYSPLMIQDCVGEADVYGINIQDCEQISEEISDGTDPWMGGKAFYYNYSIDPYFNSDRAQWLKDSKYVRFYVWSPALQLINGGVVNLEQFAYLGEMEEFIEYYQSMFAPGYCLPGQNC